MTWYDRPVYDMTWHDMKGHDDFIYTSISIWIVLFLNCNLIILITIKSSELQLFNQWYNDLNINIWMWPRILCVLWRKDSREGVCWEWLEVPYSNFWMVLSYDQEDRWDLFLFLIVIMSFLIWWQNDDTNRLDYAILSMLY